MVMSMPVNTENGIVAENILSGVDNSGLSNTFVDRMSEAKKRTNERRVLAIRVNPKDENTTPFIFDSSPPALPAQLEIDPLTHLPAMKHLPWLAPPVTINI